MSHFTVAVFTRPDQDYEDLLAPFDENIEPGSEFGEFIEDDDYDIDEVSGRHGYWTNPDAKWDWYSEGGRWSGLLELKESHARVDSAPVNDCVFDNDTKAYNKALKFWDVVVDGKPLPPNDNKDDYDTMFKPEYYKERYDSREDYARSMASFSTHAFLTADGEWFEQGEMGWFGMDDSTKDSIKSYGEAFRKYLEQAKKDDLTITIVDCHI